jgi:hypothetical protein
MAEYTLIFIPDISGFTELVTKTEIDHSRYIIAELLELLIDADQLEMTLAEIEGNALFFYRAGDLPSRESLFRQIETMYLHFHSHLVTCANRRLCRCRACMSASGLRIRFVAHAGPVDLIEINGLRKPFGPQVVMAHSLLKNSVKADEYALLSEDLHELLRTDTAIQVRLHDDAGEGSEVYDAGTVDYCYFPLQSLRQYISPSDAVEPGERVKNPWIQIMHINAPAEVVYDLLSNFDRRAEWTASVDAFEYERDRVTRTGTEYRGIIDEKYIDFEVITSDFGDKWVYGERTTDVPVIDALNTYFVLEPIDEKHTKLTVEVHPIAGSAVKRAFVPALKFLAWSRYQKNISALKPAAEKKKN